VAQDPADRRARRHLGRALLASGRVEEGLQVLGGLLEEEVSSRVLFDFGLGCVRAGRLDSAQAAFAAALEIEPESTAIRINLALLEESRGDPAGAREQLLALEREVPDHFDLQLNLGRLALVAGDREAARRHYRRADALAPGDPRPRRALESLESGGPGRY
jgi:Flp pilus assembly protein TadD